MTDYLAPYRARRVRRPVCLELTEHSFPVEPSAEQSWLSLAFRAFSRLAGRMSVRDFLIIGTGNGLDVLGALEIFDLRSMAVTDLYEESLSVARQNVLAHLEDASGIDISFHAGDLFSCVPPAKHFCLIYENLPNIRAAADQNLELGTLAGRFFDAKELRVPKVFETHQLALHYECLQQASGYLRDGGGALTAIGGRIPLDLAFDLHRACGYRPELVAFDLKIQSEPDLVLPAYCLAEEQNRFEFRFYAPEALGIVAELRLLGLEGQELADAVEDDLLRHAMSAHEAMDRRRRGQAVAHSVFMILGEWRELERGTPERKKLSHDAVITMAFEYPSRRRAYHDEAGLTPRRKRDEGGVTDEANSKDSAGSHASVRPGNHPVIRSMAER